MNGGFLTCVAGGIKFVASIRRKALQRHPRAPRPSPTGAPSQILNLIGGWIAKMAGAGRWFLGGENSTPYHLACKRPHCSLIGNRHGFHQILGQQIEMTWIQKTILEAKSLIKGFSGIILRMNDHSPHASYFCDGHCPKDGVFQ